MSYTFVYLIIIITIIVNPNPTAEEELHVLSHKRTDPVIVGRQRVDTVKSEFSILNSDVMDTEDRR